MMFEAMAPAQHRDARAHRPRGYTYVGLMMLVGLIALAAAATLSAGMAMDKRAKEEELLFIGGEFARAFRSYHDATPIGQRSYPARLDDLLKDPRYPGVRRHLRRIYVDPFTGKAAWGTITVAGGIVGVHSLSDGTPLKVAEFAPEYAALSGRTRYREWAFGFMPAGVTLPGNRSLAGHAAAPPRQEAPGATEPAGTPSTTPRAPVQPDATSSPQPMR